MSVKHIALMASGSGTNAQRIIEYFAGNDRIRVTCLLSNNPEAYALVRAASLGVETMVFTREDLRMSSVVLDYLVEHKTDLIVLAGFLWLIPGTLIERFTILNIHPALLPKYGGKNMYGNFVHEAVIRNGEKESGITIHYVNEKYDEGAVIFQANCEVIPEDTPETLASRIHQLEYEHYPRVIEQVMAAM
jgi:phosphoribosylglycinamide formyltransferase-1